MYRVKFPAGSNDDSAQSPKDFSRSLSPCEILMPDDYTQPTQEFPHHDPMAAASSEHTESAASVYQNPVILLELDMDCNVRFISKNWENIVGTRIAKIVGRHICKIILGSPEDQKVFNETVGRMMTDDSSYRVKFVCSTNDTERLTSSPSTDEQLQGALLSEDVVPEMRLASSEEEIDSISKATHSVRQNYDDTLSEISTNGGCIEMEGQGILIHNSKSRVPTHSMWMLKPFVPIDNLSLELPERLVQALGFGINIFEMYLMRLIDCEIIDIEAIPQHTEELCRICEQKIPSWWMELHTELCLCEHRAEDTVQQCHEELLDHLRLLQVISDTMERSMGLATPSSSQSSLGSAFGNPSTQSLSSNSSASSTSSQTSIREYKGFALPTISSTGTEPQTPVALRRRRSETVFAKKRFPLKNLDNLRDYCNEALSINPGEVKGNSLPADEISYSPASEKAIQTVLEYDLPMTSDPAIKLLTEDTRNLVQSKVDAILRLSSVLQYSNRLVSEIDLSILETIRQTVRKIRDKVNNVPEDFQSVDANKEAESPKVSEDEFVFAPAYKDSLFPFKDKLFGTSSSSMTDAFRPGTPSWVASDDEFSHPESSVWKGSKRNSSDSASRKSSSGSRKVREIHDRSTHSPARQPSPVPSYFPNSPMTSIQRNPNRAQRSSAPEVLNTPSGSPFMLSNDHGYSSQSESHSLSVPDRSGARSPMSPLLMGTAPSKPSVPSIKDYEIIKPISKGAFGSVFLTRRKMTGDYFAIKVLKKSDMIAKNQVTNVKAERAIMMAQSESPFVAQLYSSFQSKDYLYLVMEYLNGGDCASLVKNMGTLPDGWAKRFIAEVVMGVEHLHQKGIVHRDLKPDNLLINHDGHLKLTDFGLSRMGIVRRQAMHGSSSKVDNLFDPMKTPQLAHHHQRTNSITPFSLSPATDHPRAESGQLFPSPLEALTKGLKQHPSTSPGDSPALRPILRRSSSQVSFVLSENEIFTQSEPLHERTSELALFDPQTSAKNRKFVGTPDYLAPETVQGYVQDEASDWWSIGCILFEFLFGYPPFHAESPNKVFDKILYKDVDWPALPENEFHEFCSDAAKDLISKLLVKDPAERLGSAGAQGIKSHPYFKSINWDTLLMEEASFVPNVEGPEDTEYFELRGAEPKSFPTDDSSSSGEEAGKEKEGDTTLTGGPSSDTSLPKSHLGVPHAQRDRRGSRLTEKDIDEFGSFQFRNLAALEKANKDVINRLKYEHQESTAFASPSSSDSGSPAGVPKQRGLSFQGSHIKRSISPSLVSSGEDASPVFRSTDTGSPVNKFVQPLLRSSSARKGHLPSLSFSSVSSQQSDKSLQGFSSPSQKYFFKGFHRTASEASGSDAEEFRQSHAQKVHASSKRRSRASSNQLVVNSPIMSHEILFCEPIPIHRFSTENILHELNCEVTSVSNATELVRKAAGTVKYDFILTALKLPNVKCVDIVKLIRRTSSVNSDTPIIALTAFYKEAKSSQVFDDVLEKPASKELLDGAIKRVSQMKREKAQEAISDTES